MDKGQCFNCDQPWCKGHKCKEKMSLLLMEGVAPEGCDELSWINDSHNEVEDISEIDQGNLYALTGYPDSKCYRMQGEINDRSLQILVDGGCSHNFIQTRVARFLGILVTPSAQFFVIVGNGQNLKCVGQCLNVSLTIQGHKFKTDFYVIDLHGADVILGVAWQETLGEIKVNFRESYLKFQLDGKEVFL